MALDGLALCSFVPPASEVLAEIKTTILYCAYCPLKFCWYFPPDNFHQKLVFFTFHCISMAHHFQRPKYISPNIGGILHRIISLHVLVVVFTRSQFLSK